MEHAPRARHLHGPGRRRADRRVRPVLPRRPSLRPRPPAAADPDVPPAVCRWPPDDLPDPYPRPVLVHPTRPVPPARRSWHPGHRDPDRGVRTVDDTPRLGLGGVRAVSYTHLT